MTPAEIAHILAVTSPVEQAEMLKVLEAREAAAAEQPQDNTPDVADLLASAVRLAAKDTDDPVAFVLAWEKHRDAAPRHWRRLRRGAPKVTGLHDLLRQSLPTDDDHLEAARLATADGFPDPFVRPVGPMGNPMGGELGILQRR